MVFVSQSQTTNISGVINNYGSVTNISTTSATLASTAGFSVGDKVVVIQMKGVTINPANNINYGMITSYNDAGNYELTTLTSVAGNVVTFASPLLRSYSVLGLVQIVRVPVYTNATITASLTCLPWNGTVGGILAFEVNGTLTFNADIDITGRGFRGGNPQSGNFTCAGDTANYVMAAPSQYHGEKGEGVYLNTAAQMLGKGRNANGGGGGNDMNGGAGGGGNFGAGGRGGNMFTALTCPPNVVQLCGAVGAQGLNYSNAVNKIFMGGGGGTGNQNNGSSPIGGHGGGIAIIRACNIVANTKTIFSNGIDMATFYCIDGHGGGGAGGSVLLDFGSMTGGLNVSVFGGKGGSDTYGGADCHGKGGGGGGGIVWVNNTLAGITTTLTGGVAGIFTAPSSPCYNTSLGATAGLPGASLTGLIIPGATPIGGTMSVIGSTTICPGQSATLTASGGTTYTWMPGGFNTSSISVSPTVSTVYTVVAGSGGNCTNTGTVAVTIANLVMPAIIASTVNLCSGQSATLTAGGATAYTWSPVSSSVSSVVISPTISTTYTVYGSSGTCSDSKTINIVVNSLPVISATSSSTAVCSGSSLTLNGTGGINYTWNPGGLNGTAVVVSPLVSTTYSVTGVNAAGCSNSATVSVNINSLPTPSVFYNNPLCEGQTLYLTGSGGITYSWSGPNAFSSSIQNPTITPVSLVNSGVYALTVTDANACVNTTSIAVVISFAPSVTVSSGPACVNSNLLLSASGGNTYSWSGPNGFTSVLQNPVISNVSSAASGQYTVVVSSGGGCVKTATISVIVNPLPAPQIISGNAICINSILTLSTSSFASYNWSGPNGFVSLGPTPTLNINSLTQAGMYQVVVTDANGCSGSAATTVTVLPLPNAQIVANGNSGCIPVCASFSVVGGPNITNAVWNLGNTTSASGTLATACYYNAGTFTVNVFVADINGCTGSSQNTVTVYPKPIADFVNAPVKPTINSDVFFTDASHGANIVSWNWYFTNTAQYTSNWQNPSFVYAEPGTYVVALVVKSDKGCWDTLIRTIIVEDDFGLYVPNAFTPNADGLNDFFVPKGFGIAKFEMQIFDHWGERVFRTKSISEGWDGKYQGRGGEIVKDGAYVWLINVTGVNGKAHELKGHVTLMK